MLLALVAVPLLAAILLRAVPIWFSVIWIFLWWAGVVSDNSATAGLEWLEWALYGVAAIMFAAATIASVRWVQTAPRN
jgi:hypothetical protein